jgi:hypothetical protein
LTKEKGGHADPPLQKTTERSSSLSFTKRASIEELAQGAERDGRIRKAGRRELPSANKRRHKLHGDEACAAFITLAAFDPPSRERGCPRPQLFKASG